MGRVDALERQLPAAAVTEGRRRRFYNAAHGNFFLSLLWASPSNAGKAVWFQRQQKRAVFQQSGAPSTGVAAVGYQSLTLLKRSARRYRADLCGDCASAPWDLREPYAWVSSAPNRTICAE